MAVRLGELLIRKGLLDADDLEQALELHRERGDKIGKILVDLGFVNPRDVLATLSEQLQIPLLATDDFPPVLPEVLTPDHRLWDTLQATSDRVKVIRPDPFYIEEPDMKWECSGTTIKLGTILELWGSAPDDQGRTLLTVIPWRERELFVTYWGSYCSYLIDSRFTAPTLEVCAADWDADACIPIRERFNEPDPEPGFEQGRG